MHSPFRLTLAALVTLLGASCSPMRARPAGSGLPASPPAAVSGSRPSAPAVPPPPAPAEKAESPAVAQSAGSGELGSLRLEWLVVPTDHSEALSLGLHGDALWVAGHNLGITTAQDFFVASLSAADGAPQLFQEGTGRFVRALASSEQGAYLLTEFVGQVRWGPLAVRSRGSSDVFLARLGPDGLPLWGTVVATSTFDRAYEVAVAADGGAFVLSSHLAPLEHQGQKVPAIGREDAVLTRFSPEGQLGWAVNLGTKRVDRGRALALTEAGEAFVAGTRYQTDILGPDAQASAPSRGFVARVSAAGAPVWLKELGGSGEHVELSKVALSPDGALLALSGEFSVRAQLGASSLERAPGSKERATSFVALLSGDGELLWAQPSPKVRCWLTVAADALVVATNQGVLKLTREAEPEVLAAWGQSDSLQIDDCLATRTAWYVSGLAPAGSPFLGQALPQAQQRRLPHSSGDGYSAFVAKLVPSSGR